VATSQALTVGANKGGSHYRIWSTGIKKVVIIPIMITGHQPPEQNANSHD
jgi:hypothetical protein